MASISVPCPKTALVARVGSNAQNSNQKQRISFHATSNSNPQSSLSFGFTLAGFERPNRKQSTFRKMQAHLNEAVAEKSLNSAPLVDTEAQVASLEGEDEPAESNIPDASAISEFMSQVSDLVKLVDSRDIVELQLKQSDCELTIRKKEALPQPAPTAPMMAMPPYPQAMFPSPPPAAPAPAAASPTCPAPALASLPPAKSSASSHPPMTCPMAGNFYRSPAPSEPPFVKVGDKVQKGQIICIIEAMKLMNEIEADKSGTITEILVENGKPVSVGLPLFVIVP